jgi:NADH-quinone oxidoreductase subunit M
MSGEIQQHLSSFTDLSMGEKAVLYPVVLLIIIIGIYPAPLMSISEPAVASLLNSLAELTTSIRP